MGLVVFFGIKLIKIFKEVDSKPESNFFDNTTEAPIHEEKIEDSDKPAKILSFCDCYKLIQKKQLKDFVDNNCDEVLGAGKKKMIEALAEANEKTSDCY